MNQLYGGTKTWEELGVPKQIAKYSYATGERMFIVTNLGILKMSVSSEAITVKQKVTGSAIRNQFYNDAGLRHLHFDDWIEYASDYEWVSNNKNEMIRALITRTTPFTIGLMGNPKNVLKVYARGSVWTFVEFAEYEDTFFDYDPSEKYDCQYELESTKPIVPESPVFDDSPYQLRIHERNYAIYQPKTRALYYDINGEKCILHNIPSNYEIIDFGMYHDRLFILYMNESNDLYLTHKFSAKNDDKSHAYLGKFMLNRDSHIRCLIYSGYVVILNDYGLIFTNNFEFDDGECPF